MTDLAYGGAGSSDTPVQLLAGDIPPKTESGTLVSGENLPQYSVVARIAASGKLTEWDLTAVDTIVSDAIVPGSGAAKAIGILVYGVDASGGDKACQFYTHGSFNRSVVAWPSGTTAAQKAKAFDGTGIATRDLL